MHTPKAVPLESTRLRPPRLQPLVPDPRVVNPDVAHQLRAELSHKIFRDFPVTKFIQCVYRYNPSDIPRSDKPYSIGHKLRRGYHGVTTRVLPFGSQEMILGTFDRIIRDLTKQVIKASGKPDRIKTLMDYSKEEWDHLGFFGFFQKTNLISRVQMEKIDLTRFAEKEMIPPLKKRRISPQYLQKPQILPAPRFAQNLDMLTDDELFPVKEIHRLFTHGVRTFVSGYSVLEREVTLWYADRMGIVKSKPFDFYKDPHLLLLFAAALCNPHPHGLGILPFVHCDETGCRLLDEFRFPRLGHFTVNQPFLSFQIDCSLGRLVYTANDGVDARGTSVWPILSADQKSADLCGTGRLVAKIAWPRRNAPREDLILKRIRRKLEAHPLADAKKILDHIVDLKFSLNLTMDHGSLDIPRAKMGDFYGVIFQERVCSILVMEEYFHLRSVADSFEFEKVYIDAIVAYDWVFNVANVLHRDISMDNIMFRRNPDNSVQGVLCDWDNALIRPILGHMAYTSDPPPCIPLYMSIDRLLALSWHADRETLHPDHRIEHDLESFFYLLVYFIATQNQKHCTWVAFGWLAQEPWDYVAQSKRRFLLYDDEFNRFFPPNLGEYQRYLDPNGLVHKLRAIWMKAYTWKAGSGMRSGRPIRPARIFKALGVDGFKQPNV